MDEWEWLDALAARIGEAPVARDEVGRLLRMARDVAHGVERKLAPLSTFLAGVHVGRLAAAGEGRDAALGEVVEAVAALLPPAAERGREGAT